MATALATAVVVPVELMLEVPVLFPAQLTFAPLLSLAFLLAQLALTALVVEPFFFAQLALTALMVAPFFFA
jgi:hypothetical protein